METDSILKALRAHCVPKNKNVQFAGKDTKRDGAVGRRYVGCVEFREADFMRQLGTGYTTTIEQDTNSSSVGFAVIVIGPPELEEPPLSLRDRVLILLMLVVAYWVLSWL